ncbi:MAG: hypothetical protein EOO38_07565 [Cytophagaceae bacterium]|nr:MAG: hypothetical protein EOO38_07565 [Cytophagaceae bacterium]
MGKRREALLAQLQGNNTQAAPGDQSKLQTELQGCELELEYMRRRSDTEVKAHVQDAQVSIMRELSPLLATFAKEQGLAAVFASPATPLLYVDAALNVTDAVLAYYDSKTRI